MTHESCGAAGRKGDRRERGKYANYFQIGHNAFEVVIDFGQAYSEGEQEEFHTRIITSPSYAKELLTVLSKALKEYEQTYGSIDSRAEG
jgi:hypothetical protein